MKPPRIRQLASAAIPVLTAGIFLEDLLTPQGVNDWVLYFIPLLLSFYASSRFSTIFLAGIFSVLTGLGFSLSPPGLEPGLALINLLLGLGTLWVLAFVVAQLRKSSNDHRKMSAAVTQSPMSVVITDLQGNIEYVNPKFCEVTGYSFAEVRGKNPRVLKSGEMLCDAYCQLWATITGGGEWHGEFHNRKKNGDLYWESASISPIRDALGNISHFIAIKEDITARRRAAQELADSRKFLASIINTVADPIFVKDRQHRFVVMNAAGCALLNRRRHELIGHTDEDFFPQTEVDVFWERDEQIFNTVQASVHEETLTDATGQVHTLVTCKNRYCNDRGELFLVGVLHDISEHKELEAALQANEARLRLALVAGGLGAFEHVLSDNLVLVSPEFCQILALPPLSAYPHDAWIERMHPDDRSPILAGVQRMLQERTALDLEYRLCLPDGSVRWIRAMASPVVVNGTVERVYGVVQDITTRKQLETSLRESDRCQKAILDNIPDPAWLKDAQGRYVAVNQPMSLFLRRPLECVLGKTMSELLPEQAAELLEGDWQAMQSGKTVLDESCVPDHAGCPRWFESVETPIFDERGEFAGIAGIARDITERRQAAQHLADSREFLDRIINTVGEPIFVKDRQHRWVIVNAANCALIRRERQELLGKTVRDLFPKAEADMFWNRDEAVFNTGVESIHEESITDAAGNVHNIITRKSLYRNEQGEQFIVGVLHDITKSKVLEAALRESDRRQKAILDNIPDPAWLKDSQGRYLAVNQSLARFYGKSPENLVGHTMAEFLPEQAAELLKGDQQAIQSVKPIWGENRILDSAGVPHWFESVESAIFDERGELTGIVGIARDITERKQADEAQKEQLALRERLAKIAASAPGIIYSFRLRPDGSTCVPYISPTVMEFCGVRAEDLTEDAAPILNLITPEDQPHHLETIAESARTLRPWRNEFRFRHPQKGLFWVEGQSTPEREADGSILWHGFMSDITERKRTEQSLRESEEKFRQLADNISDVFWMTSPNLDAVHYVSAGYELIWGLSRESLYAHPHQWVESILPEERERVFAIFGALMGSQATVSVEYRITRPDGTMRWIYDRGFQVRDAAGKLVRLAGIATDITERKRAAKELAEHQAKEEHSRLELEREQALNQIKSRFVSMVSHEFRTPLCVINMAASFMDQYADGLTAEERSEHAQDIKRSVGRMTGMMEDFLVHDKVQAGKMVCRPARVNLEVFCRELIQEVVYPASAVQLVQCMVDPAAREARLDEKILRHILGNLLTNAIKYSFDGQPVILEVTRVAGSPVPPGETTCLAGDHLQFKVSDSGIGIPAADFAKLYQTFHRATNVGNRPGTGMGLAIVKQFVNLHGGRIQVESQVGQGTTFRVFLPDGGPMLAGISPLAISPEPALTNGNI